MKNSKINLFASLFLIVSLLGCSKGDSAEEEVVTEPEKEVVHYYKSFRDQRLTSGTQSKLKTFNLHKDLSNIKKIKMFIKLRCPSVGCNAWDVYANIKIKDPSNDKWYEIGRYITPYGVDNSRLGRGFEVDVTDFKSLLQGDGVQLQARIETWGSDGWELSVDFDYVEGTPDYKYYAISNVLSYDDWSWSGVPYGVDHSFDLEKTVKIPANAEATTLRTTLSGWGHATPNDADGRPCAEWCFRTHKVYVDGSEKFSHYMGPIGCDVNKVGSQAGNWKPDRAGWCPGMAVPVREDKFSSSMAGKTFAYKYNFQDWSSEAGASAAYVAISSFVVVKSNTEIVAPTVTD